MAVVYLAYANNNENYLSMLEKEQERVFQILAPRFLKGHYTLICESASTIEKVNNRLRLIGDQLAVFLFSGHAGSNVLHLEGNPANSTGLPLLLQSSIANGVLKLVVLNGCSTAGQVSALLDAGVPAVVATNSSVGDEAAKEFAVRFFDHLANDEGAVKEAFRLALNAAQFGATPGMGLGTGVAAVRNIGFAEELPADTPLWGLYCRNDRAAEVNPLVPRNVPRRAPYEPNIFLVEKLFAVLEQSPSPIIQALLENGPLSFEDKKVPIINHFPFPIATGIQQLLADTLDNPKGYDKVNEQRLQQIGRVYHSATEFLAIVVLSQLWEERMSQHITELPDNVLKAVQNYFHMSADDRAVVDYIPFIRTIRQYFDGVDGVNYFVEELGKLQPLVDLGHPFGRSCMHLHQLRVKIVREKIKAADIEEYCIEAEKELVNFLSALGFLYRYKLNSIYNIDALKYRHDSSAQYRHKVFQKLLGAKWVDQSFFLMPECMHCKGIVLLKTNARRVPKANYFVLEPINFLNLTPFLIDKSAYEPEAAGANSRRIPVPMFFKELQGDGTYVFKQVEYPDKADNDLVIKPGSDNTVPDSGYQEEPSAIRSQLEAFRSQILLEQPTPV